MVRESRRISGLALALAAALACPGPARAVFVADELREIENERLFDTEYFLDLRSFAYPREWERQWEAAARGYRINGASLDRTDLYLSQQLWAPARLNDWLEFRYRLAHSGDKERSELHQWLRLDFGPWAGFTAGLFGEPSFDKEDADIGLRLAYRPAPGAELYASANAVDFNFNERGKTGRRYDRKPITYELGFRTPLAGGAAGLYAELDAPLVLQEPALNRVYDYQRKRYALFWELPARAGGGWNWRLEYLFGYKRESDSFAPDATASSQGMRRRVHQALIAADRPLGERWSVEAGLDTLARRVQSDFPNAEARDAVWRRWELLPYARGRWRHAPWGLAEAAVFLGFGEKRRRAPRSPGLDQLDAVAEAKLGLGYEFLYGERGRIGLYGTFDLDDAGTHAWDGGNIRAMILF